MHVHRSRELLVPGPSAAIATDGKLALYQSCSGTICDVVTNMHSLDTREHVTAANSVHRAQAAYAHAWPSIHDPAWLGVMVAFRWQTGF